MNKTPRTSPAILINLTRKRAIERFDLLKDINHKLIAELGIAGIGQGQQQELFYKSLTIAECQLFLKNIEQTILTPYIRQGIIKGKSKMKLAEIITHLDMQIKYHGEIDMLLATFSKKEQQYYPSKS